MAEQRLPELPYERVAMAGGEMPDGLDWYDRMLFLQLRLLYSEHKQGIISRETATREKRKVLTDYENQKWHSRLIDGIAEKIKSTECAISEYRKNRTLENADAVIFAYERVPVKIGGDPK